MPRAFFFGRETPGTGCCALFYDFLLYSRRLAPLLIRATMGSGDDCLSMTRKTLITTPHPSVREVAEELGVSISRAKFLINLMDSIASHEPRRLSARFRRTKAERAVHGLNQPNGRKQGLTRVLWQDVLAQLPKQFKVSQVKSIPAVRFKAPAEVRTVLNRWIQSGAVERKAPGVFERVR
jgi:hypothetical protein